LIVNVGSISRFYTFDLARQMHRLGKLGSMYTAYPKWKVDRFPPDRVRTFPWWMMATSATSRFDLTGLNRWLNWRTIDSFDRWVESCLQPCDVYHCLTACGLRTHRVARQRYGALTVCDRGSSHIVYQDRILQQEHERWSLPYKHIDERVIAKEQQEYEECDIITVPSTFAYNSFISEGISAKKLRKISFGVDLELFRPVKKKDEVFRVIYVGTVSVRKGLRYLLEALEPLLKEIEIWVIGTVTPEMKPLLSRYEDRVRFFGPIPRSELYEYYSQGSVFVLPSLEEGLALVQAQAMACGLPIIATTNTGAEDLFTDGIEGFIVPIRAPDAIREKVLHLYKNPEVRSGMGDASLRRVQSIGGWDSYGDNVSATYADALRFRDVAATPQAANS
jgi:glycosyltransferase involved in cell wall biosynthesis